MAYQEKNRWSLGHNLLSGITLSQWWRVLVENKFSVDFYYLHRVIFLSCLAVNNSISYLFERLLYDRKLRDLKENESPLFAIVKTNPMR